jgi:uncharacterized membrane protein
MNAAQLHLALNHFPIAGTFLAFGVLIWGFLTKKELIKTVGIVLMIVSALTAFGVSASGDGAEETVEHKPLVTKALIHEHEEAADAAMILIQLTAVLGIAWLVMNKLNKNHQDKVYICMLITNIVAAGLIANAAHKGGMIRHDEIRDGAVTSAPAMDKEKENEEHEKK